MMGTEQTGFFRNAVALTIASLLLGGCLTGESESRSSNNVAADHRLSGSVGDGPVVGATMRIRRNDGVELAQTESDSQANYDVTIQTFSEFYPLTVDATNGTDLVTNTAPDFVLLGAVMQPGTASVANVNPFSTFAVELARDLPGGITQANLLSAQGTVSEEFNNGLTSLATSGPMTTTINSGNVAQIIRASEALGEIVRRTRDALSASGFATTGDAVVRALSSDLTDGVVDGAGGSRANARTAAVATLVSAQVLLETMANELHVNGANATQSMNNAISQVSSAAASPTLEDLTVTGDMLSHARVGLVAAHATTNDSAIADLLSSLDGVMAGASSSTVRTFALPSDYRTRLSNAILLVAGGSDAVLTTVNDIANDRTQTIGGANRAPNISGTPPGSVQVGSAYSFTPSVSDADNDPLSFTISGLPSWASFNDITGQVSGTPQSGDVGTYAGISITVSDGEAQATLGPFTITVSDVVSNSAPQISGTPPAEVTVGQNYFFAPTATDADNDTLSFTVAGLPLWAAFDENNGRISGIPQSGDVGVYSGISISVSDGQAEATLGPFTITVNDVVANSAPQISGTPPTDVNAGQGYSFTPTATDADNDPLSFTVAGLPVWASFDAGTGEISGTPQSEHVGTYTDISITVSDGQAQATLGPFTITVQAVSLGSVTLEWTAPTQNEDGTELTDLDGYIIFWGTEPGVYPNSVRLENESLTTYVVEDLAPGTYRFAAKSFNTAQVESRYSGVAIKVVE